MIKIIRRLRQHFCCHAYKPTRFQALVPGMDFECAWCGKHIHLYSHAAIRVALEASHDD